MFEHHKCVELYQAETFCCRDSRGKNEEDWEDWHIENSVLSVGADEYGIKINFCPFCGVRLEKFSGAKKTSRPTKNVFIRTLE